MESTSGAKDEAINESKKTRKPRVKKPVVKCVKEGCSFKKSENAYCGKHQAIWFLETTEAEGKKVCVNYIRGCRIQLEATYTKSKCEDCLKKDRTKDQARRKEKVDVEEGKKRCTACLQEFELECFNGLHGTTLTCKVCRDANKRADLVRDKEHVRELGRKNSAKPERIEVKKEWKEKNYEKVASYWMDSRKRLVEANLEVYLKKNAEKSKRWRVMNPDKMAAMIEEKTKSIDAQYKVYQTSSKPRQLEFSITSHEFTTMVKLPCYYCGIVQEKGFNGIDRLDSTEGYIKDNCVSCCHMCNMMKGTLGPNVFVHQAEHIATHLKIVNGKLYPEEFLDVKRVSYSKYIRGAEDRDLHFELTEESFDTKINDPCYLCGKEATISHQNGIDRVDNSKGYTEENSKGCCSSCNYLKREYEYPIFIGKLERIYHYQQQCPIQENSNKERKQLVPGNKLSKEEQAINREIRKKNTHDTLFEKYTNEEKKKEWIAEIVRKRREKKPLEYIS